MSNQVCLSVLLFLYIFNIGNGYYYHWYTTLRMKMKILFIDRELIMDAIRNTERIEHLKQYYEISPAYDIAQMLYYIRSKFARMVRVYILATEKNERMHYFHDHLPSLVEIQRLGMDIYNLIEMLEEYTKTEPSLTLSPFQMKFQNPENTSFPFNMSLTSPKILRQRFTNAPSFGQLLNTRNNHGANFNRIKGKGAKDAAGLFDSDLE